MDEIEKSQNNNDVDAFMEKFTQGLTEDSTDSDIDTQTPSNQNEDKGDENSTTATEGAPGNEPETPKDETPPQSGTSDEAEGAQDSKQKVNVEEHFNKSNQAFAEKRTKQKAQTDLIMRLAQQAGFNAKTPEEAMELIGSNLTSYEAKKKQLDPAVLQELQQREAALVEKERHQLKIEARAGFDNLRTRFNLDENKVLDFAQKLQANGINPFEQRVDLEQQYKLMEFDTLIAAAKEAGRQEEIARRNKVKQSATTPNSKVGGTEDTGGSINTTEELKAFLGLK